MEGFELTRPEGHGHLKPACLSSARMSSNLVEAAGFEPATTCVQSRRSGQPELRPRGYKRPVRDSNPQPSDRQSDALTVELTGPHQRYYCMDDPTAATLAGPGRHMSTTYLPLPRAIDALRHYSDDTVRKHCRVRKNGRPAQATPSRVLHHLSSTPGGIRTHTPRGAPEPKSGASAISPQVLAAPIISMGYDESIGRGYRAAATRC